MEPKEKDWYKNGWTLDIKNQSWVEETPSGTWKMTRLYHTDEIATIMKANSMKMMRTYSNFSNTEVSENDIQMEIYSEKI